MTETVARATPDHAPPPRAPTDPVTSGRVVAALAAAAAVAAAFAGCHPAGWAPADVVLTMALAAGLTLVAARARPWTLVVLAAPGLVLAHGFLALVSLAALGVVAWTVLRPPARPWQGALAGALAVQVLLRLPGVSVGDGRVPLASAAIAALAMTPTLCSAWLRTGSRVRRNVGRAAAAALAFVVVAGLGLAVAAWTGRSGVEQGRIHAERGLSDLEFGQPELAAPELDRAAAGFDQARHRFSAPWAWPARVVPGLGHYAADATLAADTGYDVAVSAAQTARQVPYDQLSPKNGHVDLDLLRAVGPPIQAAATELEVAAERMEGLDTTWLIPPLTSRLDSLRHDLRKTVPEAERAAEAVQLAPAMVGGDGTRHYLVLFANPAEARSLGGYVGAYGVLTADNGTLEFARSGRTAELRLPPGALSGADPAGFEERYSGLQPATHLGNVSASPDFGAVATESARVFGAALDTKFDGVVYVDPQGLAALLTLTGPINVEGLDEPLTEHNVAEFLLREQYTKFGERADRFDFLAEASTATFKALTNAKLPEPRRAFEKLYPAVESGRLRFVSFDAQENDLLTKADLTGSFPDTQGGDLLSVRSSNTSPNKTDAFVQRAVRYEATVDPKDGSVDALATVTLTNQAPLDLPAYVLSNRDFQDGLANPRPFGSNSTRLAIYSPLLLDGAQADGGDLAVGSEVDAGVHVYSVSVTVPSGGTVELRFHLHGTVAPGGHYQLTLVHQATANDDDMTVEVRSAAGGGPGQSEAFAFTENRVLTFPIAGR